MKIPEKRKTEKQKVIENVYIEEIQKYKWKIKEKHKNLWEIEMRDFSRIFIFILASNNSSEKNIIIKTRTKTLFILMKSSYPTYHNNKIEE